ncbi:hypothetical protein QQF64_017561 [Cirrhinus molitorella]|uniref:Uncharacterized protein n=1 Tax=Cirrhinus molitorella TaxID=172907 RepID=A0ABR3LJ05_9TELE
MNHVQQWNSSTRLGISMCLCQRCSYSISNDELRYRPSTKTTTNDDRVSVISPQRTVHTIDTITMCTPAQYNVRFCVLCVCMRQRAMWGMRGGVSVQVTSS